MRHSQLSSLSPADRRGALVLNVAFAVLITMIAVIAIAGTSEAAAPPASAPPSQSDIGVDIEVVADPFVPRQIDATVAFPTDPPPVVAPNSGGHAPVRSAQTFGQ